MSDGPSRLARDVPDDTVLPFQVESLDVRGRIVRLGDALDRLLARHAYPAPVARAVAEAVVLTALLGSSLKGEGRLILQAQGDGPLAMLVVDFDAPDKVRACARFEAAAVERAQREGKAEPGALLGHGHLAMTIDQGPRLQRYQGLVALDGDSLEDAARAYFLQSEQIPTLVRLAVAEGVAASDGGYRSPWRAAGLIVQFLPESPERRRMADLPPGDAPPDWVAPVHREDASWTEARALSETVTGEELVDPDLSPERLLYRLFHEHGVRVFDPIPLAEFCRCSPDGVVGMLRRFSPQERADMVEEGRVRVTCEFCSRRYDYAAEEVLEPPAG